MSVFKCLKNTGSRNVHAVCVLLMLLSSPLVATADLVLHLACEDAVNPMDASADPTPVVVHGQLNSVEAMNGNGLEFDGNSYIEVADADKLEGMSSLTIALWLKPRNQMSYPGRGMGIVSKRQGKDIEESYSIYQWKKPGGDQRYVFARVNPPGTPNLASSTELVDNTWRHIAFVFDGQATGENVHLYINGVLEDTQTIPDSVVNSGNTPLWIGGLEPGKNWRFEGVLDDVMIFNHALTHDEIQQIMSGQVTGTFAPKPENGATFVLPDADLSWKAGKFAVSHDVFLGTVAQDVMEATVTNDPTGVYQGNQIETTFDPGPLAYDQEYFWKVTEVNDTESDSPWEGDLWSFSTEPYLFDLPVEAIDANASSSLNPATDGPENTINGSGLDESGLLHSDRDGLWAAAVDGPQPAWIEYTFDKEYLLYEMDVWNHNGLLGIFGIKEALIEYSPDGVEYMTLGTYEFLQAPGTAGYAANTTVDFGGIIVNKVKITAQSGYLNASSVGLSEVRFKYLPVRAYNLSLADGTTDVPVDANLSWLKGRQADVHEIGVGMYVNDLPVVDAVSDTGYNLESADLILGQTYYYKIVEVNEVETSARWATDPRVFTVANFLIVDNMESYSNEEDARIFNAWVDGYDNPTVNGALVGADPLIDDYSPETEIVHWGNQSLPIHFDNTTASKSEAIRTFDEARNWSRHGITTLSLFVGKGDNNTGSGLYLKINDTQVPLVDNSTYPPGYNPPSWVRYNVDLTALDVSNVKSLAVGVEGTGAKGVIYVDDIRLYAEAPELPTMTLISVIEAESGTITAPFEILSSGASGGQYIMVPNGTGNSADAPAGPDDGWAVYTLDIPEDGDYQIAIRGFTIQPNSNTDDSIWVNIPGMIVNDAKQHNSGWLRANGICRDPYGEFVWDFILDDVEGRTDPVVFTLTAGQHDLQISRREDGLGIDAIAILAVE